MSSKFINLSGFKILPVTHCSLGIKSQNSANSQILNAAEGQGYPDQS
jgi:hypothetical protein